MLLLGVVQKKKETVILSALNLINYSILFNLNCIWRRGKRSVWSTLERFLFVKCTNENELRRHMQNSRWLTERQWRTNDNKEKMGHKTVFSLFFFVIKTQFINWFDPLDGHEHDQWSRWKQATEKKSHLSAQLQTVNARRIINYIIVIALISRLKSIQIWQPARAVETINFYCNWNAKFVYMLSKQKVRNQKLIPWKNCGRRNNENRNQLKLPTD